MKVIVEIPAKHINGCLRGARIGYWGYVTDLDFFGGVVDLHITEQADNVDPIAKHHLNDAALTRGLQLMAQEWSKTFSELMTGYYDADTGDILIQLCVFGEVKYG